MQQFYKIDLIPVTRLKIAIIADWLVTYGGAERVLNELHALYPDAPFFTTVARREKLGPLKDIDIRTTHLQNPYNLIGNHQVLLPWMPQAIESIDLSGFNVVISSSHAVGKGVIPPPHALHICYCHTPMRYAWEMEDEYLHDFGIPNSMKSFVKKQLKKIRRWDLTTAKRVDVFIANSTTTQERIKRIYGRESIVIPPPVDEKFFSVGDRSPEATSYFLAVGRLVPYKRFDLLIKLANELQLPLKIAGRGQDEERLKKLAGPTVEMLGYVSDEDLGSLYAHAEGFFFPQIEDAGIALLEAQACGTPVIAYKIGGAADVVVDNTTGVLFEEQSITSMADALKRFRKIDFDREAIRAHARKFSQTIFRTKLNQTIAEAYTLFKQGEARKNKIAL